MASIATPAAPVAAEAVRLEDYLSAGLFTPAAVQREFRWGEKHLTKLMEDFERAFMIDAAERADLQAADPSAPDATENQDAPEDAAPDALDPDALDLGASEQPVSGDADYYLGSFVLRPTETGRMEIYDGLQRSCALTILAAVLRDQVEDAALSNRLHSLIEDEHGRWRLALLGKNRWLSERIQPRGEALKRRITPTEPLSRQLLEATRAIRDYLADWTDERRQDFARFLLSRVYLTIVVANTESLARRAFVTANDRGLSLEPMELLKGLITDMVDDPEVSTQILNEWSSVEQRLQGELPDFLRAVDFLERRRPHGDDGFLKLEAHLRQKFGPERIRSWVGQLVRRAQAWEALTERCAAVGRTALDRAVWRCGLFRFDEWRPLALHWFDELLRKGGPENAPKAELDKALRRFDGLHRRCLAVWTLQFASRPTREEIFARALDQASLELADPRSVLNLNAAERDKLRLTLLGPLNDARIRSALVKWLEEERRDEDLDAKLRDATIEHVLPQNPEIGSDWMIRFPDPARRAAACHSLGNLAAISDDRVGVAPFGEKQSAFRKLPEVSKTLREVCEAQAWDEQTIAGVTKARADEILAAIRLPEKPRPASKLRIRLKPRRR